MKRKDIKSMTLNEVQQYILREVRFGHQTDDIMLMYYQELYSLYVKCVMPAEHYYALAHEVFDYINRDKDV